MEALSDEDWDLIYKIRDEYYEEHKKVIIICLSKLPMNSHDMFLMMANEINSVYSALPLERKK